MNQIPESVSDENVPAPAEPVGGADPEGASAQPGEPIESETEIEARAEGETQTEAEPAAEVEVALGEPDVPEAAEDLQQGQSDEEPPAMAGETPEVTGEPVEVPLEQEVPLPVEAAGDEAPSAEAEPAEALPPSAEAESAETEVEPAAAEPPPAAEPAAASVEGNGSAEAAEAAQAEEAEGRARDPFRGPGDWYVVHTYAGYENKVKTNLESRIHTMQMEDKIFNVHIPMEDVMEIKSGKKQVVQRKVFPGYLLVKMIYDNDSWYVVRNTPGVTGFVAAGTGSKPTPLSKREVEKILVVKKEEVKPQFRLGFEEGDVVRIISGPFADFNGTISEINLDQSKLKVLVNIFDRETPVELSFDQVAKV